MYTRQGVAQFLVPKPESFFTCKPSDRSKKPAQNINTHYLWGKNDTKTKIQIRNSPFFIMEQYSHTSFPRCRSGQDDAHDLALNCAVCICASDMNLLIPIRIAVVLGLCLTLSSLTVSGEIKTQAVNISETLRR